MDDDIRDWVLYRQYYTDEEIDGQLYRIFDTELYDSELPIEVVNDSP